MYSNLSKTKRRFSLKPEFVMEIIYVGLFFAFIGAKCTYFQFTSKLNTRPISRPINLNMLVASAASIIIVFAVVYLIFNKKRLLALYITEIFLSILLLADTVFFRYYRNAITVPVLYQVGLVSSLGESIMDLLKPKDIIFIIDLPFMAAGMIFLLKKGSIPFKAAKRAIFSAVLTLACILAISLTTNHASAILKTSAPKLFTTDKNNIMRYIGVFTFHYYDVKTFITENAFANKFLSADEKKLIKDFYASRPKSPTEFSGAAKGKNLIVIQMESIQEFLINMKFNGKEVTPFLNSFLKESTYFDNFYYQVGNGNTSDAEFLLNASLYPIDEGAVYFRYPVNTYNTLPKALKKEGYTASVFHAYMPSFWNRTVMYSAIGFDRFYSSKDFKLDQYVGWGLSDEHFLKQSLDKMNDSKPFYNFFITLSSHYPNAAFEKIPGFDVGEYEKTNVGNYLKAANYVDSCLKQFIEGLKKKGLYDNSIILIYGDHFGILKKDAAELMKFLNLENTDLEWMKIQKVPLILHCPGVKTGETISTTGGEIDLFPTIANLMGIDAPYALGKDLLNTKNGYAVLRHGSFVTDRYIYLGDTQTAYDLKTNKQLSPETYADDSVRFQKEYDISQLIIKKDAFKKMKLQN